jgi:acyl carrier protein
MNKNQFIEKVKLIFDETPEDQITLQTNFKNLEEWNSLLILSLIVTLEENFSILISANDIEQSNSFEELFDKISI